MEIAPPEKVLITGGREVGGLMAFAMGLSEGFAALGIPSEVIPPHEVFKRWRDLRDPGVLKILSTTAVFAAPLARRAICVAHGFPRADAQGWGRMAAILGSFKLANSSPHVRLVAVSDYVAAHLRGPFSVRVDAVIRNPIQSCFLETANGSNSRNYITYVGRLLPAKNVHRLLPAMCDLRKEKPELRICVVGEGPQRELLEATFRTDPPIKFTGSLDPCSLRSILRQTKVFVSGCETEALGISYLEALSQGCAVAMPACGGGVEIALDLVGTRIQLLPLSFERQVVLKVLRRALDSPYTSVSLGSYEPRAVAQAYLQVDPHNSMAAVSIAFKALATENKG
jgi:glycosyltransferase involved in cell wall biosynthesis